MSIKCADLSLNDAVTIQGNTASGDASTGWANGGGIYVTTGYYDNLIGPIVTAAFQTDGTLTCDSPSVIIQGNIANRYGGGIYGGIYDDGTMQFYRAGARITCRSANILGNSARAFISSGTLSLLASQISTENVLPNFLAPVLDFDSTVISGDPTSDIGIYQFHSIGMSGNPNYVIGTLAVPYLVQP